MAGLENPVSGRKNIQMLKHSIMALILFANGSLSARAHAAFCARWSEPVSSGNLPFQSIREASGMAASKLVRDRIYWINDSGDKGAFYFTRADGSGLTKVKVKGMRPRDTEAIGYAECPEGPCIAIADIGDNKKTRKEIQIVFVKELSQFPSEVPILKRLILKYPDQPHDAEAIAFLPSGDLILITKELNLPQITIGNAVVYTLSRDEIRGAGTTAVTLKKIGELPVPAWLAQDGVIGKLVTDAAVNHRRAVLGVLTYSRLIEIPLEKLSDLANAGAWKSDYDFSLIAIKALGQQESVTYWPDADRLTWSTEYMPPAAPIFSMTCEAPVN